jgi:CubicO group peptidase (beta-lactamase class C family)
MTKQFTAVCILQLLEQGKLTLGDEITKYIPDYPVNGQKITIENLLTHTSGIVDPPGSNALQDQDKKDATPEEIIRSFKNQPLAFTPGTKMVYSNAGYMILGYIIEKVAGMSYAGYLGKYIFTPLGMTHTYYGDNNRIIPNRVPAYIKSRDGYINFRPGRNPYAAGTILSTAEDLLKWNQALKAGKLVKKETLEKAFTSYNWRMVTKQVMDTAGRSDTCREALLLSMEAKWVVIRQTPFTCDGKIYMWLFY